MILIKIYAKFYVFIMLIILFHIDFERKWTFTSRLDVVFTFFTVASKMKLNL